MNNIIVLYFFNEVDKQKQKKYLGLYLNLKLFKHLYCKLKSQTTLKIECFPKFRNLFS